MERLTELRFSEELENILKKSGYEYSRKIEGWVYRTEAYDEHRAYTRIHFFRILKKINFMEYQIADEENEHCEFCSISNSFSKIVNDVLTRPEEDTDSENWVEPAYDVAKKEIIRILSQL